MARLEQEFSGRVAVVTGSSKGIGRATAERLARGGAAVVINSRDEGELDEAAKPLRAEGAEVHVAAGNVARAGGAKALIDAAVGKYGRVDLVVNTVGLSASFGPLLEVDFDAFSLTMIRNTWPTVELAQAAVAAGMGRRGDRGRVYDRRPHDPPRGGPLLRQQGRPRAAGAQPRLRSSARAGSGSTPSHPG